MKIADFFAEIGFKVDLKSLQDFNSGISTVVNTVKGLTMSLTGAMTAWELLQTKIGKNAQTMLNFKTYTGESIGEVNKLAAVMAGTNLNFSMDTLLNDISTIKTRLRELQIFGEGSSMAQALRVVGLPGLNPGAISTIQDFLKMLRQIPDPATRTMLAERMGLSKQFLNVLELTDEQYKKLEARAPKLFPDEKELKRRQEASLEIFLTWQELSNLFESRVTDFAPILLKILEKIKDILSDSKKLKAVMDGVKWTFIVWAITSVGTALGIVLANLRGIVQVLGIAGGIALARKINEKLGIDNSSTKGIANQSIGATTGFIAVGGALLGLRAAADGIQKGLKKLFGGKAASAAAKGAAKGVTKGVAKAAAGAAARQGAAGAANINPYISGALLAWGLFDIGKAIFDAMHTNTATANPSTENNQNLDWNKTLANLTINAQDVYINANNVHQSRGRNMSYNIMANEDYSQQQNNVVRSRYSVTGGW